MKARKFAITTNITFKSKWFEHSILIDLWINSEFDPPISSYPDATIIYPSVFIQLHDVILHGIASRYLEQRLNRMYKTSKTNIVNHHGGVFVKNNHLCKFIPGKISIKSVNFNHKWLFTLSEHFINF